MEETKEETESPLLCGESITLFDFMKIVDKLSLSSMNKFMSLNDFLNSEAVLHELSKGVIDDEKSNLE